MLSQDIIALRLKNQQLIDPSFTKPSELVQWLGVVQAQDYAGAKWALANRLKRALDSDIDHILDRGEILRTHVLRPTWHFVLPQDIRWMIALTEPRITASSEKQFRDLDLDKTLLKRSNKVIVNALKAGNHLTRKELAEILQGAGISTNDLRLTFIIFRAELDQLICSGPRQGKQFSYALLEQCAPNAKLLKHDEALAELAKRYFKSRGPALTKDFTWWSGLSPEDARKGIELVRSDLMSEKVNGQVYFFSSSQTSHPKKKSAVHLLPAYDEYTVAYNDRSLVLDPKFYSKAGNGIFNPNIVVNGEIKGAWRRTVKSDKILIDLSYFHPVNQTAQKAVYSLANRYAKFLGKKLEWAPTKKK